MEQDFGQIQDFLIGEVGLKERETYHTTFKEFRAYTKAFNERLDREWQRTRLLAFQQQLFSQMESKYKKKSLEEYMHLPSDDKRKAKSIRITTHKMTKAQEKELFRIISNIQKAE